MSENTKKKPRILGAQEIKEMIRDVMDKLKTRDLQGEDYPQIIVIDATRGTKNSVFGVTHYFSTFEEFEREAQKQEDAEGLERVRRALTARPGKLVIYAMFKNQTVIAWEPEGADFTWDPESGELTRQSEDTKPSEEPTGGAA